MAHGARFGDRCGQGERVEYDPYQAFSKSHSRLGVIFQGTGHKRVAAERVMALAHTPPRHLQYVASFDCSRPALMLWALASIASFGSVAC